MSVPIDITHFPNFLSVLMALEKLEKSDSFTDSDPEMAKSYRAGGKPETKPEGDPEPELKYKPRGQSSGRQAIDRRRSVDELWFRLRLAKAPCSSTIDMAELRSDPRLTDAGKKLNNEELNLSCCTRTFSNLWI